MSQQPLWDAFYKTNQIWHRETLSVPKVCTGKRILELGCGNGKTLKALLAQEPRAVVAVDFSAEALKQAKKHIKDTRIIFLSADVCSLSKNLGTFDVIVCYYLLNNLTFEEQRTLFKSLTSFLNATGILLIEEYVQGDHREQQTSPFTRTFITSSTLKKLLSSYRTIKLTEHSFSPYKQSLQQRKIIRAIATHPASSTRYDNFG